MDVIRYVGRIEEVLVEKRNERHPAQVKGRNRQGGRAVVAVTTM